jgi:V8-like Glu-specific endopeptidase
MSNRAHILRSGLEMKAIVAVLFALGTGGRAMGQDVGGEEAEALEVVEWVDPGGEAVVPSGDAVSGQESVEAAGGEQGGDGVDKSSAGEKVFGKDDRVLINPSAGLPWRAIGRLSIYWKATKATWGASGALIGPRTVLTCGHAVVSGRKWADSITFTPAQNGNSKPYGSVKVTRMQTLSKYWSNEDRNYDMALLTLEKPIGNTTGYMWVTVRPTSEFNGSILNISGYPADLGGTKQYFAYGPSIGMTGNLIYHRVDIMKGHSGSPTWMQFTGSNQQWIVGVLVAENADYNYTTYISSSFFNVINNYLKANDTISYKSASSSRSSKELVGPEEEVEDITAVDLASEEPLSPPSACGTSGAIIPVMVALLAFSAVRPVRRGRA